MTRLANISGKQAVKTFKKFGWNVVGQLGSHVVMTKPGIKANLSVPQHKEVSIGLLRKLIKYAEIEVDEFLEKCK
jgi:predicted RNA binding protein YcfA (HicA-like mRNA interferase family)